MNIQRILTLTIALTAALALPSTSFAGKGKANKGAGKGQRPGQVVRGLDKDGNHKIDGDEIEALKKAFTADPKGPLAALDKNKDSMLEDDEIAALNARLGKHEARATKKGAGKGVAKKGAGKKGGAKRPQETTTNT